MIAMTDNTDAAPRDRPMQNSQLPKSPTSICNSQSREPRAESLLLLVYREREERVLIARARCHDDELLARLGTIRHRVRRIVIRDLRAPDFFAGFRLERVEVAVAASNEDEAALRHHGTAKVARRPESLGQRDPFEQRVIAHRR